MLVSSRSSQPEAGVWSMPFSGPWLALRYRPTSLWSLKSSGATSSGAKSLLVPTPYGIKLGLIDAAIQAGRVSDGVSLFTLLRGRPLRICPPASAVVSATFLKTWKVDVCPDKAKGETDQQYEVKVRNKFADCCPLVTANAIAEPGLEALKRFLRQTFAPTVGFREYIQFSGEANDGSFQIIVSAIGLNADDRALLARAAVACTYSGKRGCFLQFVPADTPDGLLDISKISTDAPYTLPCTVWQSTGDSVRLGSIQALDELSEGARWDSVNTYGDGQVFATSEAMVGSGKRKAGPDRVFVESFIPYRLMGSSKGYNYYRRTDLT
jgi:hypothetical protein